ncbi:MAG: 2-C-methyl-D-erythritol 4-phosphate cytidylyltransferase [Clostridiales bacterium]|nr:2-C-methyl-D-erythritol 4-phosphate cytidylyltransferase [Clostridiales bacterium]
MLTEQGLPDTTAIIVAAGRSARMGGGENKVFRELAGKPVLAWSLELLQNCGAVREIIIAVAADEVDAARALAEKYAINKMRAIVAGGECRAFSVRNALAHAGEGCPLIAVHDAARPLLLMEHLLLVIETAARTGAAILAAPLKETVKQARGDKTVAATLDRSLLYAAQTPQVFRAGILRRAYAEAGGKLARATDDAALVEMLGQAVSIVEGGYENIKLTTPEDFAVAEAILRRRLAI